MKARILLVAVLALFSVASFAGDGYGKNYRLLNAATELDHAAQYYAKQVSYHAHSRKFNKAARRFAHATAYFCSLVDQGADIYDLHHAYEKVQARFYQVHQQASSYQRASYGYSKVPDIYKVKYAFDDVGRIVNRQYNRHARRGNYGGHKGVPYDHNYGYNNSDYGKRGYGKESRRGKLRGRISNRRFDYGY